MIDGIPFVHRNGSQSGAAFKGRNTYARYVVRNGYGGQAAATAEGVTPDACYAAVLGDHAVLATKDQSFALGRNNAISRAVIDGIPFVHRNGSQAGAACKGRRTYVRHTVRNVDGGQAAATAERFISYARHAARDSHGCQTVTIIERRIVYCVLRHFRFVIGGESVGENDFRFVTGISHEPAGCPVVEETESVCRFRKPRVPIFRINMLSIISHKAVIG